MNRELSEPSAHERRVADEEEARAGQQQDRPGEPDLDEARKRWERIDAEDPDVMDEERDEPPPAGYIPRTG
jgi:hypothetical protein